MSPTLIWGQPILSHSLIHSKSLTKDLHFSHYCWNTSALFCAWLTQLVWRPPALLEAQLETPELYRKLLSWSSRVRVSHSTVKLHPLEEDVLFWVCDFTNRFIILINIFFIKQSGFYPDLNLFSWKPAKRIRRRISLPTSSEMSHHIRQTSFLDFSDEGT